MQAVRGVCCACARACVRKCARALARGSPHYRHYSGRSPRVWDFILMCLRRAARCAKRDGLVAGERWYCGVVRGIALRCTDERKPALTNRPVSLSYLLYGALRGIALPKKLERLGGESGKR